jgi:4-hydroxy-tetrahydrodipicolinate synthase
MDVLAYNESWLTGNVATQATVCDLATIPRLVAIKESTGVASTTRWMAEHRSELPALFQGAEALLQISAGFDGFIVAAANLLPEVCHRLYSAPEAAAFRKFKALCRMYGLLSDNWIARIKAELQMQGLLSTAALVGSGGESLKQGA